MDIKRLERMCKSIDYNNYNDLLNDTFLQLNGRYKVDNDIYYKIFYTTAKNIHINNLKKKKLITINIGDIDVEEDIYNPSIYKLALDSYLIKNKSSILADLIELYLVCPNISEIAKQTNINRLKVHRLIENAKNGIGIEYIRIASNIDSDNDFTV